jgi:riboflavin kinase/FMN adenylyltransferase
LDAETAITIGNFDGVHLGHVRLIGESRKRLHDKGRIIVLSFDPHPATVLRPQAVPPRLSSFRQRTSWCKHAGANEVLAIHPSPEVLRQSPEEFLSWLVRNYSPRFIVEGPDFRFGRGRAGSVQTLRELEASLGYQTVVVDPVCASLADQSIVTVSSTMIRWVLERGRVRDAQRLLGRPYEICAKVVAGDKRGRNIGVPTINLDHQDFLLPADGIYSGEALLDDHQQFRAAISVGTKPTFGKFPRVCEAHLIGFHGRLDDYGWHVRLRFHDWLRDQLKYDRVDRLIDQLRRDIERCMTTPTSDLAQRASEGATPIQ